MKRTIQLLCLAALFAASLRAGAQVARVRSPLAEDAVFPQGSLTAEGPDGARLIVGGAAMITATSGSAIVAVKQNESGQALVKLGNGAFNVHVGSKPVVVEIGGASVEAASAVLMIVESEGAWLARVLELLAGGRVEVMRKVVVASSTPEPPPTTPAPPPKGAKPKSKTPAAQAVVAPPPPEVIIEKKPLNAKQTYRVDANGELEPASAEQDKYLKDMLPRFVAAGKPVVLKPAEIEDPADLAGAASGSTEDAELAEIEAPEVEIEADCVEICMD